jgi:hypothetical protein
MARISADIYTVQSLFISMISMVNTGILDIPLFLFVSHELLCKAREVLQPLSRSAGTLADNTWRTRLYTRT